MFFSKNYNVGVETPTYGYVNKGEKGLFQRRFFEYTITSENELNNQIDYIHYNPVKHGIIEQTLQEFDFFELIGVCFKYILIFLVGNR